MSIVADFSGKDLEVRWTPNANNASNPNLTMKDTILDFVVNDVVVRTKTVPYKNDPKSIYFFDEMVKDQGTSAPSRTVVVRARERDMFLRESASDTGTFTNPRPAAVSFTANPFLAPAGAANGTILIKIVPVTDEDLLGYQVFRGTSAGFTPSAGNRVYMGPDTQFFDETVVPETTYYYKVAAYDKFSSTVGSLNFGAAISAKGTFALEVADIKFKDVIFTPNADGVTNRLRWTGGTALRTVEGSSNTEAKAVTGSYISNGTTERYIYFDWDDGLMKSNTSIVNALAKANNRILATYNGGTNLIQGVDQPIIDGQKIITGTIGAAQLITNQAIITGTAQIANAVIGNAQITNVDASKITTGYLNAGRIQAGTITTGHMGANTINGNRIQAGTLNADRITAGTIETGHMTANTIHGNRLTANTLHANRITANTITATQLIKTQALITTSAQIDDLVVGTGHIKNLSVDTIKITNDAVGRVFSALSTTERNLSVGVEYEMCKFTIPSGVTGKIFLTGNWRWEADDDPDVRYRIVRTRAGTAGALASYTADGGHGEISVQFSMSVVASVTAGDVLSIRLTRLNNRGVMTQFGQIVGMMLLK